MKRGIGLNLALNTLKKQHDREGVFLIKKLMVIF